MLMTAVCSPGVFGVKVIVMSLVAFVPRNASGLEIVTSGFEEGALVTFKELEPQFKEFEENKPRNEPGESGDEKCSNSEGS